VTVMAVAAEMGVSTAGNQSTVSTSQPYGSCQRHQLPAQNNLRANLVLKDGRSYVSNFRSLFQRQLPPAPLPLRVRHWGKKDDIEGRLTGFSSRDRKGRNERRKQASEGEEERVAVRYRLLPA